MLDHEKENPKNHHLTSLVKAVVTSLVKPMVTTLVKPLVKTMVTYLVKDMVIVVCEQISTGQGFKVFVNAIPEIVDVGDLRGNAIL